MEEDEDMALYDRVSDSSDLQDLVLLNMCFGCNMLNISDFAV